LGLAEDLLRQAEHLIIYEGTKSSPASLRRAVSTAYYALFHRLTEDAAGRWPGTAEARTSFERGFKHGIMRGVSLEFGPTGWKDRRGNRQSVPLPLQRVAKSFATLQDERHSADYDNSRSWSATDANEILDLTRQAFREWDLIREDPMAGNYLIAMLLGK